MIDSKLTARTGQGQDRHRRENTNDRPAPTWGIGSCEFYALAEGKMVQVCTLDAKIYCAKLKGVDVFDLILQDEAGALTLIPKHAVKYVKPRETAEGSP